jgi:LDH2 family malate/lactate/ureidoglycolate dehydrogenase
MEPLSRTQAAKEAGRATPGNAEDHVSAHVTAGGPCLELPTPRVVDLVVVREGKNVKGRALAIVVGIIAKPMLGKQLGKTVMAIETRNDAARPAGPTDATTAP